MALRLFLVRVKYEGGWALVAGKNEQAIFDALGNLDADWGEPDMDSVVEVKSGFYVYFQPEEDQEEDEGGPEVNLTNGQAHLNGDEQDIAGFYQPPDGNVTPLHENPAFEQLRIEDPRVMALYDPEHYVPPVEGAWVPDARWAVQQNGIGNVHPAGTRICVRRGFHQGPVTLRMDLGNEAAAGWDAFEEAAWAAATQSATLQDFEPALRDAARHHLASGLAEKLRVKFKAHGSARSFYVRGGTIKPKASA